MAKKRKQASEPNDTDRLSQSDWLAAAREELISRGILAVKAGRLAKRLRITRGSFYWHFNSLQDLLDQLLRSWVTTNTEPFRRILESRADGESKLRAVIDLWLAEEEYDPKFDTAVREWARISPHVARSVRRADNARISVLREIFLQLGYKGDDALVRARITYFHQVGYYTLGIVESAATRRALRPYYTRALLGTR